jgi:hypothetical protein
VAAVAEVPEWVEAYRRDTGQWPPGWSPTERRREPWLRAGAGVVGLVMAAACLVVVVFVVWFLMA